MSMHTESFPVLFNPRPLFQNAGITWMVLNYLLRLSREQRYNSKCCSSCEMCDISDDWCVWEQQHITKLYEAAASRNPSKLSRQRIRFFFFYTGKITWIRPCPTQRPQWRTAGRGLAPGWLDSRSSSPWTLRWPGWSDRCTEAPCLLERRYFSCQ